jgi:hypothetical protein
MQLPPDMLAQLRKTRIGSIIHLARTAERHVENFPMRPGRAVITAMRSPRMSASSIEW